MSLYNPLSHIHFENLNTFNITVGDIRGSRCYKVDFKFFSLTRPGIIKQLGSYESPMYPLEMGYGSLISDKK